MKGANAQNHMEIRIWLASDSRPSTATASFTNGGSTYTPAASGSNLIAMATHGSGNSYSVHATLDNLTVYDGISGSGGSGSGTTYTYAGTSYANPHAPTTIGSRSLSYDNNGNLTTIGTTTYTWDYKNRLTRTVGNSATTTYGYDHTGQRVWMATNGTATTTYISKWYDILTTKNGATTTATTTSSLFTGDTLIGSITTTSTNGAATTTPTISYIHTDHLNSTNVMTNASGTPTYTLDYLPYGERRVNTGTDTAQREYIGERYDEGTRLSYLNARYYEGSRGQFLSQDPVFWEMGKTQDGKKVLANPQLQNSYSYAGNNPITLKDPDGRHPAIALGLIIGSVGYGGTYYSDIRENQRQGITGLAQFAPRESFVNRGTAATIDVGIGFVVKNPVISGISAAGASIHGDLASGQNPNYGNAFRSGIIGFGSDLILGPLSDAPAGLRRDFVQFLGSGILNLGGNEFFKNTQLQQSQQQSKSYQYYSSPSSLPSTVTQNGTTYYRTKDGLLSDKPQK